MVEYNQYGEQVTTPPGHIEGASPSQYEINTGKVSSASNPNDITSQRIRAGYYNEPVTNPYPTGSQEWYRTEIANRENAAKSNTVANPIRQYRPEPTGAPRDYFMRSGVTKTENLGDTRTQKLISEGYSPEQALTIQKNEATTSSSQRYYENERQKALQNNIEYSSGYHTWAKDTGIPQAANPYEYVADLSLYTLKGTQGRDARFSPVDPSVLNLPGGKGVQDVAWERAVANDKNRPFIDNYNFNPAMDKIAAAKANREMGPYGNLNSYSSTLGNISLAKQQEIGLQAATTAKWNPQPQLQELNPAARDYQPVGGYKPIQQDRLVGGKTVSGGGVTVENNPKSQFGKFKGMDITSIGLKPPVNKDNSLPILRNTFSQSEEWITGIPWVGDIAGMIPGVVGAQVKYAPTSKVKDIPFFGNWAKDASVPLMTEYEYGTPYERKINIGNEGGAVYTRSFVVNGKPSDSWTYPVGNPIITPPTPIGNPKITTSYDPRTGITTTDTIQEMQSGTIQNYETVTLPKTEMVTPILGKTSVVGFTNFQGVQRNMLNFLPLPSKETFVNSGISFMSGHPVTPSGITAFKQNNPIKTEVLNGMGSVYDWTKEHPLDLAGYYVTGAGVSKVLGLSKPLIAGSAMSKLPVISTLGRAASTPLAADAFTVANWGVGAYIAGSTISNVVSQPTLEKKVSTAGISGIQLGVFAKGFSDFAPTTEPYNTYAGKTFFTGESKFSPLQSATMDFRAYATSFKIPENLRSTYRSVPKAFRETRFLKPQPGITETTPAKPITQPDISLAQTIGAKRAPAITGALAEQPHVIFGSVVMEGQRTGLPSGKLVRGAPNIHDLDLRVEHVPKFEAALKARGETTAGMDIKPFEPGYPSDVGYNPAFAENTGTTRIDWMYRLFGEPIPTKPGYKLPASGEVKLGGKDYTGQLNSEPFNVQVAGRKSQAFMQDMVPAEAKRGNTDARAMNEEFRIPKDFYDVQSGGKDLIYGNQARRLQAGESVKVGSPTKATEIYNNWDKTVVNYDFMPIEDNPIIGAKSGKQFTKSMTLGEVRVNYEAEILKARASGGKTPSYLTSSNPAQLSYDPSPGYLRTISATSGSFIKGALIGGLGTYKGKSISSLTKSSSKISISPYSSIYSQTSGRSSKSTQSPTSILSKSGKSSSSASTQSPTSILSRVSSIPSIYSSPSTTSKPSKSSIPSIFTTKSITSKPSTSSTTSRIYKTNITYLKPIIPSLPSNKKSVVRSNKSYFGFREIVPTWTPQQQARAIFGKYKVTKGKNRRIR